MVALKPARFFFFSDLVFLGEKKKKSLFLDGLEACLSSHKLLTNCRCAADQLIRVVLGILGLAGSFLT